MSRILRLAQEAPPEANGRVVTVGNFDGVHLGHQSILTRTLAVAREMGLASAALTFEPHPSRVLADYRKAPLIYPYPERYRLLERMGVDLIAVQEFTAEVARVPAAAWVMDILADRLRARHVIVGYDFRFGRGAEGDFAMLCDLGGEVGFTAEQAPAFFAHGRPVSSSRIRRLVGAGEINMAADLIGSPFHLRGVVAHGDGRGATLGFPTANLKTDWELLPLEGVYCCLAEMDGIRHKAGVNIGRRPTFDGKEISIEVHLLDATADSLYGKEMTIHFIRRLRGEKKFSGPDALIIQMRKDVERTREILSGAMDIGLR